MLCILYASAFAAQGQPWYLAPACDLSLAQIVEPGVDNCRMRMVDLTSKAHNGDAAFALGAWVERESTVPFEPYRTPPVRAYLARLAEDDHAVLILMHHVRPLLDAAPLPALPGPLPRVQAQCEPDPQPCCGLVQVPNSQACCGFHEPWIWVRSTRAPEPMWA